ncbi:hypothetical protein [Polaromonas sp. A23]|uniref:hypothetical protein n=1 Tax=Polaromonas sp. A23 TaxID=1944133 RepID=UPI0011155C88|nr:hypothetical protein [Polaromonas sp. A23]
MIICPKCNSSGAPGATDCVKCGYLFTAAESNPGFSPRKIFKWWLGFYAFWRAFGLVTSSIAALRAVDAGLSFYFAATALCLTVSLIGIFLLWRGRKVGLAVFVVGEALSTVLQLLVGNVIAVIYPFIAVGVMWLTHKRAMHSAA